MVLVKEVETKYSPEKLEEFRFIVTNKLGIAREDFGFLIEQYTPHKNEDLSDQMKSEQLEELVAGYTLNDQEVREIFDSKIKFIKGLEGALERIDNGSYGICRATGKLIPEGRLRAVPHTTLTIEAKKAQY